MKNGIKSKNKKRKQKHGETRPNSCKKNKNKKSLMSILSKYIESLKKVKIVEPSVFKL